jgi:glucose/arabinose dehydrogenase
VRYISTVTLITREHSMNGNRIGINVSLLMLTTAVCSTPVVAADAAAGKALFRQQCTVCHTAEPNDDGGAQGPSLIGVFGRHAAGDPSFSYTKALQDSKLTWDTRTLDRFLTAPAKLVPGTAMAVALSNKARRADVVAYLQSASKSAASAAAPEAAPAASATEGDWKKDAPGRAHKIDLAALPAPFATASARNSPKLVPRPPYAQLLVPQGFEVGMFAKDLEGPRRMLVTPNNDVFVTEMRGGRVTVLHPAADGRSSASADVFAAGLERPFGIAFYPKDNPTWLYVAETNRVIRFAFKQGDVKARGAPEVVVPELASTTGGHSTRDIVFSPDGRRMYISVGSQSNVAESMSKKTPAQIQEWEAAHGLGAAWDLEENRADVLVFDVSSPRAAKVFASGIRNCVGLTLQPKTNDLWCTTNERDLLGDDLVPDYSTRVKEGSFFGWPWYYMGSHEDPRLKGDRPDLAGKVSVPDVPYQAHSAALGLVFYTATSGKSAFPAEYVGDGFAMLHGSWNRGFRTGHKVVRVRMKDGVPTGEYDDFMTGFIIDDGDAWGRPVSGAVQNDGSLLVSDDGGNVIYRISYGK